jgi:hypothetical protein
MAKSTAKLMESKGISKNDPTGKWYNLDDILPFIQGIVAGDLDENQISTTLITGVPTPWARTKLFSFAYTYTTSNDPNIKQSGLINFFKGLVNEWKGLLALVALFPDRVSFSEPIYMNPHGNLFEISGGFGRMLLDDIDIWTDQQKKKTNPNELPYIQLLRYNGHVIGGTSPFSIVFPGVEYANLQHASDIPWYRNGKFEDPIRYLDKDKLQKLYLFINNIIGVIYFDSKGNQVSRLGTIEDFKRNINLSRPNNPLDLSGLEKELSKWQDEIKRIEPNLQINGTVAKYSNLAMPYKALLDSHQKVYQLKDGSFTFDEPADRADIKYELDDLQNILKEDKKIIGWFESLDYKQPLSNAAVYYLPVNDVSNNQKKYFSLPLTINAIQMFGPKIDNLISGTQRNFAIDGSIKEGNKLSVDLSVEIDGQPYKLNTKEYDIIWAEDLKPSCGDGKVIMWPNFISDNWNAYYLYTEFPLHNVQGLKFIPFYKRGLDQKIITANLNQGDKVVYSNSDIQERNQTKLEITELVTYPANLANMPQYEVIKSNCPIAGLEIRIENAGKKENAGYLIVRNPDTLFGNKEIKNLTTEKFIDEATVGIDFGSNNSCAHYTLEKESIKGAIPIKFENRRLALVGIDSTDGSTAEQDELLFFSNESTPNGQTKSWLHEHDVRYVVNNEDKEIAGGVAINEKNILVREMDKIKIKTQAGTLHYNMKWLSDVEGIRKKTAYLKALWLSICADLYAEHYKPVALRWSYPGSMSPSDLGNYNNIYSGQLPEITPILEDGTQRKPELISEHTESEAVCRYALSQTHSLDNNCLFLGIDIGGSTSDILLLANYVNQQQNTVPKLYKQSSIHLAAGVFFDAVTKSTTFRKAIHKYHEGQNKIHIANIQEIITDGHKAPFYLNSLFDQLTDETFSSFYSSIFREAPFVYTIPAYVTGLLVYYSAKLSAKTIKENNLNSINEVHILPFGKGGRLFHWLKSRQSNILGSTEYYEECFRAGFGEGAENIRVIYREEISKDNKSEVAKGLSVNNNDLEPKSKTELKDIREKSDVFAEKNIKYLINGQLKTIDELEELSNNYFENVRNFDFPEHLENFEEFLRLFIDFVGRRAGLVKNYAPLETRISELKGKLKSFIENDTEYDKARKAKQPNAEIQYRIPILIAEGLCYLEQILIPEIFKA